jgi:Terminase large subunit, T4likevirus-type, N-terminal
MDTEAPPNLDPSGWYRPCQMMKEFHASKARLRALIGGRGSGKTTTIAVETVSHGFHNAGARIYILRKTQLSNSDTTGETFEMKVFPYLGTGYIDTGVSLFKKMEGGKEFRLPSRKAIELYNEWNMKHPRATKQEKIQWLDSIGKLYCSFVLFAGVPEERYRASRFRGFECSLLIFIEADQLSRDDLRLGTACIRWKGSDPATCDSLGYIRDSGVILDSNPPSKKHWIAKYEYENAGDDSIRFWHIKTKDNEHNLPPDYCKNLEREYKDNPAMYNRMLLGEYDDAFSGQRVLFSFSEEAARVNLPWPKGAYLIRSWDFGTTQSCIWSAYWQEDKEEYWWDLHELFARQSDAERQCRGVLETTQKIFPFWNDRDICAGLKDYCDIAGNQVKDTGSSVAVLRSKGIFPGWKAMGLQESLAVYNRLLEKRNKYGNLIYQIDKECCPMLYTASRGGYRYPEEGEAGYGGVEPLKGPAGGDYDHVADASRYGKYNCLRLIREEIEKSKAAIGLLAVKTTPNINKRYY